MAKYKQVVTDSKTHATGVKTTGSRKGGANRKVAAVPPGRLDTTLAKRYTIRNSSSVGVLKIKIEKKDKQNNEDGDESSYCELQHVTKPSYKPPPGELIIIDHDEDQSFTPKGHNKKKKPNITLTQMFPKDTVSFNTKFFYSNI